MHDLQVSKPVDNNNVIYVRARCWASYKKNITYKIRMIVNPNGKPKITAALCDSICPAGKRGCCCHVITLISKLDEISRNKLLTNQCKDDRPCTSKPRKWGIPWKRTVTHEPIMASQLLKPRHQTEIPGRKIRGVLSTFYDPRPVKSRKLDPEAIENFRDAVFGVNSSVPFSKMTPNSSDTVLVDYLLGKVCRGSFLHLQLKDFSTPTAATTSNFTTPSNVTTSNLSAPSAFTIGKTRSCLLPQPVITNNNALSSNSTVDITINKGVDDTSSALVINQPLSLNEIRERFKEIKRSLYLNDDDITKIEEETRGQSNSNKWFDHRLGRITASKLCHRGACPHRAGTSPSKIIKEVLNYNKCVNKSHERGN